MKSFHRRVSAFCALILFLALTLTGTFCWQSMSQQALNEARSTPNMATVELVKLESGTEIPLAGAGFLLYRVTDGANDEQVDGLFTTGTDGKIAVSLPAGNYYFIEHIPAPDHDFDLDAEGNAIRKYPFEVSEEEAENGETVTVGPVYNPRLTGGSLTISKTVENGDGSDLTQQQQEQEFTFTVTFSDEGAYPYYIIGQEDDIETLSSGGTLTLKHGQVAQFFDLPAGMYYAVTETPEDGTVI